MPKADTANSGGEAAEQRILRQLRLALIRQRRFAELFCSGTSLHFARVPGLTSLSFSPLVVMDASQQSGPSQGSASISGASVSSLLTPFSCLTYHPRSQIRSRITVVCAEASLRSPQRPRIELTRLCLQCKRLKLKCDRRNPCSSCIKRDTTQRCAYSAAAAEKMCVSLIRVI